MRTRKRLAILAGGLVVLLVSAVAGLAAQKADRDSEIAQTLKDNGRAQNVILFIGDGMGYSEVTLARDYALGAGGKFPGLDSFVFTGHASTYSVDEDSPLTPDYVTDSAAAGTAWATGFKTSNGRVSTTAGTDKDLKTILEIAQKRGFATGNVSTAEITDATPAVLNSHVAARGCQGPANMGSCPDDKKPAGPGSIAEQTVDHSVDVVLGGGKARFDQTVTGGPFTGQTVVAQAQAQGYTLVTDRAGLLGYSGSGKLLGLFTAGNMTTEWDGELASPYPGSTPTCEKDNRPATEPSLADMTRKALNLLSLPGASSRPKGGFFLQVEGASIDKQDHAENPCAQIGETVAFDEAIQVALAFQRANPDTLIVVTADHSHTSQIVEPQSAEDHGPGAIATLTTKDGAPIVVSYGTNLDGQSQSHTGADVPVLARGPGAQRVLGSIDDTDLFQLLAHAIGDE